MGSPLSPAELRKLVGILGRLGSDHDGERAAAGLLASRLLRAAGLGWDDLLTAPKLQQAPDGTQGGHGSWSPGGSDLTTCLRWLGELNAWEVGFVTDLRRKRRPLSPAQAAKLQQIADNLRARGLA